jgi:hypothetical protein
VTRKLDFVQRSIKKIKGNILKEREIGEKQNREMYVEDFPEQTFRPTRSRKMMNSYNRRDYFETTSEAMVQQLNIKHVSEASKEGNHNQSMADMGYRKQAVSRISRIDKGIFKENLRLKAILKTEKDRLEKDVKDLENLQTQKSDTSNISSYDIQRYERENEELRKKLEEYVRYSLKFRNKTSKTIRA